MKKTILTIGGSNSKTSISKQLAEYAADMISNVEIIKIDLNNYPLPLFSVDAEEKNGFSAELLELNALLDKADGFIVGLAEHNGAYSAVFKNMFDWLSRVDSMVWRNKPLLLMSTSPGARGGKTVLEIAQGRFPFHGAQITGTFSLPNFDDNFKEEKICNEQYLSTLQNLVNQFKTTI
jgi:NAD(P)H-dependent FMN reductase